MLIDVSGSMELYARLAAAAGASASFALHLIRSRCSPWAPASPGSAQPCEYGRQTRRSLQPAGSYLTGPEALGWAR